MVKLIHSPIASLDGYVEDEQGKFDWAAPADEVHAFVNARERPIGTYLYGRRMYETMVFWETVSGGGNQPRRFATSRRSGGPPRRLCSCGRSTRCPAPKPTSSALSTPTGSAGQGSRGRRHHDAGAELAGQAIAAGLVTRYTCSSGRSLLVAASVHCPTASASRSRSWTSAGSETASFIPLPRYRLTAIATPRYAAIPAVAVERVSGRRTRRHLRADTRTGAHTRLGP
jgi:hypothetical protein